MMTGRAIDLGEVALPKNLDPRGVEGKHSARSVVDAGPLQAAWSWPKQTT